MNPDHLVNIIITDAYVGFLSTLDETIDTSKLLWCDCTVVGSQEK